MEHPFKQFYGHFGLEYQPTMEDLVLRSATQNMIVKVQHKLLPHSKHPFLIMTITPSDKIDDLLFDFFNDLHVIQAVPDEETGYELMYEDNDITYWEADWRALAAQLAHEGRDVTPSQVARLAAQVGGDPLFAGCYEVVERR